MHFVFASISVCPSKRPPARLRHGATDGIPFTGSSSGQGRADDNEATARQRIATFHEQGEPIAAWLRSARVPIIELDASQPKEEVWAQLLAVGRLMRGAVI